MKSLKDSLVELEKLKLRRCAQRSRKGIRFAFFYVVGMLDKTCRWYVYILYFSELSVEKISFEIKRNVF